MLAQNMGALGWLHVFGEVAGRLIKSRNILSVATPRCGSHKILRGATHVTQCVIRPVTSGNAMTSRQTTAHGVRLNGCRGAASTATPFKNSPTLPSLWQVQKESSREIQNHWQGAAPQLFHKKDGTTRPALHN